MGEAKKGKEDELVDITEESQLLLHAVRLILEEENLSYVNRNDEPIVLHDNLYGKYFKRLIDIIFSSLALIITSPVNLVLAICTLIDVGRPILYKHVRIGRDGKYFTVAKFRNMTNATDENGVLLPPSQRVTKFGKLVRKTSLDELLNFWFILKGNMSLIGPRPLTYYASLSDRHRNRNAVRPGLECPYLRKSDHPRSWYDQFENDVYYASNVNFLLDMKMACALVKMVFNRKYASMRASAIRGSFLGYDREGHGIDSYAVPERYVREAKEKIQNQEITWDIVNARYLIN